MAYLEIVPEIPAWLLDDTEESVVGTEWHQEARDATRAMLQQEAERRRAIWGVCEEIELSGLPRPGGKAYNPRPGVMVLSQPIAGNQAAVALSAVGPPLFVAEVVSTSTLQNDQVGKRIAYALAGIPEYLLFDPGGSLLGTAIVAWRLPDPSARVYQPWLPEPDGSWRSQTLDVWFVPDQPFLRVRGSNGRLLDPPPALARRAEQSEAQRDREATLRAEAEARAAHLEAQAAADRAELERLRALLEHQNE